MVSDRARSVAARVLAGTVGALVFAHATIACADMGFSPGFLGDTVYAGNAASGASLLVVMTCAAVVSAAVGVVGLWSMSRRGADSQSDGKPAGQRDE